MAGAKLQFVHRSYNVEPASTVACRPVSRRSSLRFTRDVCADTDGDGPAAQLARPVAAVRVPPVFAPIFGEYVEKHDGV